MRPTQTTLPEHRQRAGRAGGRALAEGEEGQGNVADQPDPRQSTRQHYVIRVAGHLAASWSDAFEGMKVTPTRDGETMLTGPLSDQAALHGLLARIRDLNLTLLSVMPIEPDPRSARRPGRK